MSGKKKDDEPETGGEPWEGYPDADPPAEMQGSEPGRVKAGDEEVLRKGENQGEDTGAQPRDSHNAPREDVAEEQARQDLTNDEWKEVAKTFDTAIFKEGMEAAFSGRAVEENPYFAQHQHDSWDAGYARGGQ